VEGLEAVDVGGGVVDLLFQLNALGPRSGTARKVSPPA